MSDGKYRACFRDWCLRGAQYCVNETRRCYFCKDVPHLCGQPEELPWECDGFCKDLKIKGLNRTISGLREAVTGKDLELKELNRTISEFPGSFDGRDWDIKSLMVTGSIACVLLVLVIFLIAWICYRKRKVRGSSLDSSSIKPEDVDLEDRRNLLGNDKGDNVETNDQTEIEMEQIGDGGFGTTDKSTSTRSLLQVNQDQNQQMPAHEPSGPSVENSGCPGPHDICVRGLPNAMKTMPPQQIGRQEGVFS